MGHRRGTNACADHDLFDNLFTAQRNHPFEFVGGNGHRRFEGTLLFEIHHLTAQQNLIKGIILAQPLFLEDTT